MKSRIWLIELLYHIYYYTIKMVEDFKKKRQIWEISEYKYYPSIESFVLKKESVDQLDNNDILYWKTFWFIKVSTIKLFWEEKEAWKIFILRNFFINELWDVDNNNEEFFLNAKAIRDKNNRTRTDNSKYIQESVEWNDENITKEVEQIEQKDWKLNELIRSLTPWEVLIVTKTTEWWMFRWKWSLWIPNGEGKWTNKNWDEFGWEFQWWIANWDWYVKFGNWEEYSWTWIEAAMEVEKWNWSITININDLNYDNLTEKIVVQKHQDWWVSVYENK